MLPGLKAPSSIPLCNVPDSDDLFVVVSYSAASELWRVPPAGPAALVTALERSVVDLAASRHEHSIVYSVNITDANLWALSLSPVGAVGAPRRLDDLMSTRNEYNPQYSPDGGRLIFESDRTGFPEVWISDLSGANAMALTHFQGPVTGSPRWSPDGKLIAFDTRVKGRAAIFITTPEGKVFHRITEGPGPNVVPSWSRDGRWIYFASKRTGRQQIWRTHLDGSGPEQITREGGFAALQTPDGKALYYTKSGDALTTLWRTGAQGGLETQVATSVLDRSFAVASKGVYFVTASDPRSSATLQFLPFDGAAPLKIAALPKAPRYGVTVSPDESQIVWGQVDSNGTDLVMARNAF